MKRYHFQKDCGPGFIITADSIEEAQQNVLDYMKKEDEKEYLKTGKRHFEEWGYCDKIRNLGNEGAYFLI